MAQPLEVLRRQMDAVFPGDRIERNLVEPPHAFVGAQHSAEGRNDEREEDAKHLGHIDLSLYKLPIMITRRSFLGGLAATSVARAFRVRGASALDTPRVDPRPLRERLEALSVFGRPPGGVFADGVSRVAYRSEEHTSELQSQSNLVCRLLLEKKKKKQDAARMIVQHR